MISHRRRWTSLLVVGVVVSLIWLSFLESPQRVSSQPANGEITIVVTENGFNPPEFEAGPGVQISWRNDSGAPLTLTSGNLNNLYLPLVNKAGVPAAAAPASASAPAVATADAFLITLAPGGDVHSYLLD